MWAVEKDPALRSDFCNLTILDHAPDDDRMRHTVERAVAAIPRLGQRVVSAPLRIAPPAFTDDPTLNLASHVRRVAVPGRGTHRDLLDLCGAIAEQPFDRARPLWEFTLVEGLQDGRAALLQKIHHTITDGVGGLRLSLAFVDFAPDGPADVTASVTPIAAAEGDTPLHAARTAVLDAATRNVALARRVIGDASHVATHPTELPGRAADTVRLLRSLQRQLLTTDPARSDLMAGRSLARYFETYTIPLPRLLSAAHNLGGSINDAYVTGLAGALGRYHERGGSRVDELRLAMPVSTRAGRGDDAANRFVPARVVIPIEPCADSAKLFELVRERIVAARGESAIDAAEGLAMMVTGLPTAFLVAITRAQTRTTDFAATNLRGSPLPLFIAGVPVLANFPFGPRTGTALNATVLSYCEDLNLGFNIDPAAIVDVDVFMADVAESFDMLMEHA